MGGAAGLAVTALLARLLVSPVFATPTLAGDDWIFHATNAYQYARLLDAGLLAPHLTPDYYGGLGGMNFKFYAPFVYLPVALLLRAGLPLHHAFGWTIAWTFFLGGLGVYFWVRPWLKPGAAWTAAAAYLLAPYHLEDLYLRFAYPELWGFALAPWVMAAAARMARAEWAAPLLAGLLAALALLHNLSALMLAPFAAGWVLAGAPARRRAWVPLVGAGLLAAGLAAFYAGPALFEQDQVAMGRQFADPTPYARQGLDLGEVLSFLPREGRFRPVPNLFFLFLGFLGLARVCRRKEAALTAWGAALALLLTTSFGFQVVRLCPPLAYLQYPWRFLLVVDLMLAAGVGAFLVRARAARLVGFAALAAPWLILSLSAPLPRHAPLSEEGYVHLVRTAVWPGDAENKYCPVWAPAGKLPLLVQGPPFLGLDGDVTCREVRSRAEEISLAVKAQGPWRLLLRRFYVPGWEARPPHVRIRPHPETGLLEVSGRGGEETVRLRYRGTPLYRAGVGVSLLSLMLLCAWLILPRVSGGRRRRRPRAAPLRDPATTGR